MTPRAHSILGKELQREALERIKLQKPGSLGELGGGTHAESLLTSETPQC